MTCDHFRQSLEWTFMLDNLNLGWVQYTKTKTNIKAKKEQKTKTKTKTKTKMLDNFKLGWANTWSFSFRKTQNGDKHIFHQNKETSFLLTVLPAVHPSSSKKNTITMVCCLFGKLYLVKAKEKNTNLCCLLEWSQFWSSRNTPLFLRYVSNSSFSPYVFAHIFRSKQDTDFSPTP